MAKATDAFTGKNTYGVPEDYARREDGTWFSRYYGFNGYARSWTRWRRLEVDLTPMMTEEKLDYGFLPLRRCDHSRLRLPA